MESSCVDDVQKIFTFFVEQQQTISVDRDKVGELTKSIISNGYEDFLASARVDRTSSYTNLIRKSMKEIMRQHIVAVDSFLNYIINMENAGKISDSTCYRLLINTCSLINYILTEKQPEPEIVTGYLEKLIAYDHELAHILDREPFNCFHQLTLKIQQAQFIENCIIRHYSRSDASVCVSALFSPKPSQGSVQRRATDLQSSESLLVTKGLFNQ